MAATSCCAPTCLGDLRRVRPPPRCAQKRLFKIDELEGKAISGCERCVERRLVSGGTSIRCFPAIIIAGAMKAGTTEVLAAANRHPSLYTSLGEAHYFHNLPPGVPLLSMRAWAGYLWRENMYRWGSEAVREGRGFAVEKTPSYMRNVNGAVLNIARLLPSVRLIVLLREPAARAYSHFRMQVGVADRARRKAQKMNRTMAQNRTIVLTPFAVSSYLDEPKRFAALVDPVVSARCAAAGQPDWSRCAAHIASCARRGHHRGGAPPECAKLKATIYRDTFSGKGEPASLVERSVYAGAIQRISQQFACEQVAVLVSEQFFAAPNETLRALWSSLGVPHPAAGVADEHHAAPGARNRVSTHLLNTTRAKLQAFFRADVCDLAALLPAAGLERWWPEYFVGCSRDPVGGVDRGSQP